MTGYGWVNLGSADTVTAPVCADDPTTPSSTRPITSPVGLCPEAGATVWSNPDSGLCVSGAIPLANSAWEDDWGIRVGAEVSVSGGTLGKRYSTITFDFNLNGVAPTNPAIRGVVHVKDDPAGADTWYCAVIQPGVAVPLASFNPDCWWPDFPGNLAEDEIASIDEIGIQIPSDNSSGYLLNNFCWTGISLAGASVSGTGGAVGAGGSVPPSASGGGGVAGSGGASGMAGSEGGGGMSGSGGSRAAFGMPCTTKQDCSSDANCCDGGSESCDGTKLPSGDGTNSGEFVVSADGLTVTDTITGLVWQRDGWGTRAGCSGGADGLGSGNLTCSWSEAQSYCASLTLGGVSGWRLPGRNELSTLVDFTETNPCIDQTAFPNAPSDWFQTSSSNARSSGYIWNVSFYTGFSDVNAVGRVRCVRGSRCCPITRFAVLDGGLVRDTLTSLVWQQQASITMTWAAAQTYCSSAGSGFRLPTAKELISLVDLTVTSGATINQAAFPNTPAETFWTSSPNVGSSGYPWHVQFGYGGYSDGYDVGDASRVRCVR